MLSQVSHVRVRDDNVMILQRTERATCRRFDDSEHRSNSAAAKFTANFG